MIFSKLAGYCELKVLKLMKQGEENTELVKEEENPKRNYIFQKNKKTVVATVIIVAFLIFLILGLVLSGVFFETP